MRLTNYSQFVLEEIAKNIEILKRHKNEISGATSKITALRLEWLAILSSYYELRMSPSPR